MDLSKLSALRIYCLRRSSTKATDYITEVSHSRTPPAAPLVILFLRFPLMPFCAGDQSFPPSTPTPARRSREVRAVSRGVPVFVYFSLTLDELAVQWRIRVETRRRLSLGDRDTPAMRLQFDHTTTFLSCVRLYSTQSAILIYRFCLFF